jgi:hypothetical protein
LFERVVPNDVGQAGVAEVTLASGRLPATAAAVAAVVQQESEALLEVGGSVGSTCCDISSAGRLASKCSCM